MHGRGKAVLGGQPIVHSHHGAAAQVAEFPAQHVVRGKAANGEAAAVQKHQRGQQAGVGQALRGIQAHGDGVAVTRWHMKVLHTGQLAHRHLQHLGASGIRLARLWRREGVQRRALGFGHALDHALHGRGEKMLRLAHGLKKKTCHLRGAAQGLRSCPTGQARLQSDKVAMVAPTAAHGLRPKVPQPAF
jgi:hypothetical protein